MSERGFEVVNRVKGLTFQMPRRSTGGSVGYDFFAVEDIEIPPSFDLLKEKTVHRLIKHFYEQKDENDHRVLGWKLRLDGDDSYCSWSMSPTIVKTGIKAYMSKDEVLCLFSRSSAPIKKGLVLANSVGIIDSDYYNNPDNEGEIGVMFYNVSSLKVRINKGDKLCQGIFMPVLLATGDRGVSYTRQGGFGSTGR